MTILVQVRNIVFCEPVMMEDFQSAGYGVADARRSQERIVVYIRHSQTFSGDRSVTSIVSSLSCF
jgi:hypothetical protein